MHWGQADPREAGETPGPWGRLVGALWGSGVGAREGYRRGGRQGREGGQEEGSEAYACVAGPEVGLCGLSQRPGAGHCPCT